MSELLNKADYNTFTFTVTEYRRGCAPEDLLAAAGRLAASDEFMTGRLDDGYGIVEWKQTKVNVNDK